MAAEGATEGGGQGQAPWALVPAFDPEEGKFRDYKEKVLFVESIWPRQLKAQLAPRLALLCKGTAWDKVKQLDKAKLASEDGVKLILQALKRWEEPSEQVDFDKYEMALFKTVQLADETNQSYLNRLDVAFGELGPEITLAKIQGYIILKNSQLSMEDKKKVVMMTGGSMEPSKVETAMINIGAKCLQGTKPNPGHPKLKTYTKYRPWQMWLKRIWET